ncbi:Bifunctional purine biosynthesis protein PurH [Malassezia pachydermatis]|uniref:General substrate transporter n=1 Tax=Malassezia pachydermatis TaxID=77020 RepID=A0A0M9VNR0_9BASI|nr:general substrate transporter [Malassezia pachydermatis]KOS13609.1 general substrate transporter [Malassezia pachydermatis]
MAAANCVPPLVLRQVVWIVLATFQYGFGISELNALQTLWVCEPRSASCLGLSDDQFGVITGMFTIGGTISSLACATVARRFRAGRRTCLCTASVLALVGGLLLAVSSSLLWLSIARLCQGLGAGIALVQVPLYLQELAPPAMAGSIGTLNQLAVVSGIFVAQFLGTSVVLTAASWRWVPRASMAVALAQWVFGWGWAEESPVWLEQEGTQLGLASAQDRAAAIRAKLGCQYETVSSDEAQLPTHTPHEHESTALSFRTGLQIVMITQAAQQLSGVNAIMYYSTGILSTLLPTLAPVVGLLITLVNGVMTLPPLWLIDEARMGRRRLLLVSSTGMGLCCLLFAYGLTYAHAMLSGLAILLVIACFSVGLGPVPFVIIPEVLPPSHVSFGSSLGLGVNWIANILTAMAFQPVRRILGAWDGQTGGLVFAVFGIFNMGFALAIHRLYHPRLVV